MTNHLLVSRCQGDCAVAMDTPGAWLAPAINGSSSPSSPWMRLAGMSADHPSGEEDPGRGGEVASLSSLVTHNAVTSSGGSWNSR